MYKDHTGHRTYRIASASSADPRRWCYDCQEAYNLVERSRWRKEQMNETPQ